MDRVTLAKIIFNQKINVVNGLCSTCKSFGGKEDDPDKASSSCWICKYEPKESKMTDKNKNESITSFNLNFNGTTTIEVP
jgi:hypothetical protein